jgi:hypothetical protein
MACDGGSLERIVRYFSAGHVSVPVGSAGAESQATGDSSDFNRVLRGGFQTGSAKSLCKSEFLGLFSLFGNRAAWRINFRFGPGVPIESNG